MGTNPDGGDMVKWLGPLISGRRVTGGIPDESSRPRERWSFWNCTGEALFPAARQPHSWAFPASTSSSARRNGIPYLRFTEEAWPAEIAESKRAW